MDSTRRNRSSLHDSRPDITPHSSSSSIASHHNTARSGLDALSFAPDNNNNSFLTGLHSSSAPRYPLSAQQRQFANHTESSPFSGHHHGLPGVPSGPQVGAQSSSVWPQVPFASGTTAADNGVFGFQNTSVNLTNLSNHHMSTASHSPLLLHAVGSSPHASLNLSQGGFFQPGYLAQQSLGPSTAYSQPSATDWNSQSFRTHRRAPSDTFSDVSSCHQSPYLGHHDGIEQEHPSPLHAAQQDSLMPPEVMNISQVSLSDDQSQHSMTPGQSPQMFPCIDLDQPHGIPSITRSNNAAGSSDMVMFPSTSHEPFPALSREYGASDQMTTPEISIDLAPPYGQQSLGSARSEISHNALTPPNGGPPRGRIRAKSDPFSSASTRAPTPANGHASDPPASLHPNAANSMASRSPSPHGPSRTSRRSSTSNIPQRDYMLSLADPNRSSTNNPPSNASSPGTLSDQPGSPGPGGLRRTQKNPAVFQCSSCPKRFTRAYNLRSHLRTHTDERPFVCSICGKAFARQHDRKRHENLHSGEKRFVCRGVLKSGIRWGCSRRFARADALGRHFRSEVGRVCIRPLLEEEANEKGWDLSDLSDPPQQAQESESMDQTGPFSDHVQEMNLDMPPQLNGLPPRPVGRSGSMSFALPQALLQQFPALAGLQWDMLPASNSNEDLPEDDAMSGRGSFDASSGGERFDEGGAGVWEQAPSDFEGI